MAKEMPETETEVIAETEMYMAWKAQEPDGEMTYHLELNNVTLHFFQEEWQEFLDVSQEFMGEAEPCDLEFGNFMLYFSEDEWTQFKELVGMLSKYPACK